MPEGTHSASLTDGLTSLLQRDVAPALHARAALHVLDWLGCAVIGAAGETGRKVAAYGAMLGAGPATALGAGRLAAPAAAFVNGAYGNVLEMDDIHRTAVLHPGPVVVPAALAVAQQQGAASGAFLDAVVRGYEAMIRIGRATGPGHYRQWHPTATCGAFGAAAAAASLLGLDRQQTVWALGNAGTQAAGPWQCRLEGVDSKQLHTAHAAQAGTTAAMLAAKGFSGPSQILEGELGFFAGLCPDGEPAAVLAGPDDDWQITRTSFKPWPACRHAHPTIDAALALRAQLPPGEIAAVVVRSYGDALRYCDNAEPETPLQAKFSLQHCAAAVLLDGPPALESFEPPALAAPRTVALRRQVRLEAAAPFDGAYPRHYGAGVEVVLADGTVKSAAVADAWGDPENPMTPTAVEDKARMLMSAAGLDAARIDALVAAALALADGGGLETMTGELP